MLTKSINFKNFKLKIKNHKVKKDFDNLIKEKNIILKSLSPSYKNNYNHKIILMLKKYSHIRIIGMGGSSLGTESIYDFLKKKIKKNFYFFNNLQPNLSLAKKNVKYLNLVVSKSGNTLETISNSNIIIKKKDRSIFITEKKKKLYIFIS